MINTLTAVLLGISLLTGPPIRDKGMHSHYGRGEKWHGAVRADTKPFNGMDLHIAHRTIKLGTYVLVNNGSSEICVPVLDRGPYGALDSNGEWFVKTWRTKRKGKYRGIADLTYGTALALYSLPVGVTPPNGQITISYWKNGLKDPSNCMEMVTEESFAGTIREVIYSALDAWKGVCHER